MSDPKDPKDEKIDPFVEAANKYYKDPQGYDAEGKPLSSAFYIRGGIQASALPPTGHESDYEASLEIGKAKYKLFTQQVNEELEELKGEEDDE